MRTRPLGELAELTVGHVGPMAAEYVEQGVPFLRSLNIRPFRIDMTDSKFISRTFHERLKKSALRPGDVVVVRTGEPGTAAVVPDWLPEANCSDLIIVRPRPGLDSRYLSYFINGASRGFVSSRLVGAVQQHFNVGAARELPVPDLPIEEQRRIVGVLGKLDDLIDLNRGLSQRAAALAVALASASPDRVQVSTFASVADLRQFRPDGPVDHYSIPAFDEGWLPERIEGDTIKSGKLLLTQPTVLVSRLNPHTQRVWMAYPNDLPAAASTEFVPLIANDSVHTEEVWAACASEEFSTQMRARVSGTTGSHQRVDKAAIPQLMVADLRQLDASKRRAIISLVRECHASLVGAAQAARIRDELLPPLLSGRARVGEVAA
jgi:type I restriction enzyme, S subunit